MIFLILVASGSWIIAAAAHFAEKEESRKSTLGEDILYIEHDVFFFEEKKMALFIIFEGFLLNFWNYKKCIIIIIQKIMNIPHPKTLNSTQLC